MNELQSAVHDLCTELDLTPPAPDDRARYALHVGDAVLRLAAWGRGEVVMEGLVLQLAGQAADHWAAQQDMLRQVLTWNLARLKGQARPEVLSFDEQENQLLLWRTWPCDERLSEAVRRGAEEMLNELDFWRSRIFAVAPDLAPKGNPS